MSKLEAQKPPAENLADLSAPAPARGVGAADLLGPPGEPLAPWEPPATDVEENSTDSADDGTPADDADGGGDGNSVPDDVGSNDTRGPGIGRRAAKTPRVRAGGNSAAAVYTSVGVRQRFERYRHKTKQTNLQVVLEAVGSKFDELEQIIADAKVNTAPVNPIFTSDPSAVRYIGGGSVQIGYIPTPEQEKKLDEIGRQLGIETRSTWLAPVLNAFLPGTKDTRRD